ncbi:MAG: tetraacyldisaccharide 4'-kinase [Pseudomonadota bacterium]
MREPRFWARDVDPRSREAAPLLRFLLTPLAWMYAEITRRKIASATPVHVAATVICVGNLTAGGVGKSPVAAALRAHLVTKYRKRVATLSRGYGGRLKGPLKVDPKQHSASEVGDEPLMLSQAGESWIGADRVAAGRAMSEDGVEIILMDDGHQNPYLFKDFTLILVDAAAGFGNGYVIPKGPLREPIALGLARADAIITMGDGIAATEVTESGRPIFKAAIMAKTVPPDTPFVAFAGIGRPEKFFDTLNQIGVDVRDAVPFPDHHVYTKADLNYLTQLATDRSASLITTEKDWVRMAPDQRDKIRFLPIEVQFERMQDLDALLFNVIKGAQDA